MLQVEVEDKSRRKRPERQLYVPPAQRRSSLNETNSNKTKAKVKNHASKNKEKVMTPDIANDSINPSHSNNISILEIILCSYFIQNRFKCIITGRLLNFDNSNYDCYQIDQNMFFNCFILQKPLIYFYSKPFLYLENEENYFCKNAYIIKTDLQFAHVNHKSEKVSVIVTDIHNSYSNLMKQFHIFCDYDIYIVDDSLFTDKSNYKYFPGLHDIIFDGVLPDKQNNCCIFDIFDNISSFSASVNESQKQIPPINQPSHKNVSEQSKRQKTDREEEVEIMRKTKEHINRKTRPIMKYVGESNDTLKIEENNLTSWEDLFDDEGEFKEELLGVDKKRTSKTDTKSNKNSSVIITDDDVKHIEALEHMVELYDFPSTFKTQDLIQAFNNINCEGMYVKWVDETHAILVLGTLTQALKATSLNNPLIKVRHMETASRVTLAIANKSDLKPAMKRPQTNLLTARRFINAALGTKIGVSKETMAKEREDLKIAREMKKMLKQNERDAWEGNLQSSLH